MKHATTTAIEGLTERKRAIFYAKSTAFLHFHEDPAGIFADVRDGDDFRRLPATAVADWKVVVEAVRSALADHKGARRKLPR